MKKDFDFINFILCAIICLCVFTLAIAHFF